MAWNSKSLALSVFSLVLLGIIESYLTFHDVPGMFGSRVSLKSNDDDIKWDKHLFDDVGHDIFGSILAFCTVTIASAGGIGGGGLLVPIYFIVLDLGRFAIPLSKATIFGGAVSNLIINSRLRHPKADRPLIDYNVAMMLEPMTLAGTVVGVLLNTLFPLWLITLLLIWLLFTTAKKTIKKARKAWDKETMAKSVKSTGTVRAEEVGTNKLIGGERSQELADMEGKNSGTPRERDEEDGHEEISLGHEDAEDHQNDEELAKMHEQERHTPLRMISILFLLWLVIFVVSLLKGGHGAESVIGMECGTAWFWIANLGMILVMVAATHFIGQRLHAIWIHKNYIGYKFIEGDVLWDAKNIHQYPAFCAMAGIAAGLLGIGGGMVKGPLMLAMGITAEVTAATSAFMIFFTSSATTMQFIILGMLNLDYALWYGAIGFVGGYVGKRGVSIIIRKYGRPSVVIYALGTIIGLSCVVMGVLGVVEVVQDINKENWDSFNFNPLCVVH